MNEPVYVSVVEILGLAALAATLAFCGGLYLGHTWGFDQGQRYFAEHVHWEPLRQEASR